jgi:hypothetical protein
MNKIFSTPLIFLLLSLLICLFIGCEADNPPSLFDPNATGETTPTITQVIPADSTLAGIGQIKLIGTNFSPVLEENLVFFNKEQVNLISASETELVLNSPNSPSDAINIKTAKQGAYLFSNSIEYKLKQALWEYAGYGEFDDPYGIACDKNDNLYVALSTRKVEKVTPDGVRQDFGTTIFVRAAAMRIGPDDYLYLSRLSTAMYRIPLATGGASAKWTSAPGKIYDFDFAPSGVCYAGGDNDDLYRINPDGSGISIASYPSTYIKAIKVYDGYVYVGGKDKTANQQFIWRNKIVSDDELGPNEVYFKWSENIDDISEVLCIVFSADGDMYVGTDAAQAIVIVHPDGSFEPLYPGVIEPTSYAMAWGPGQYLYVNRRNDLDPTQKRMIKLFMQKYGAP